MEGEEQFNPDYSYDEPGELPHSAPPPPSSETPSTSTAPALAYYSEGEVVTCLVPGCANLTRNTMAQYVRHWKEAHVRDLVRYQCPVCHMEETHVIDMRRHIEFVHGTTHHGLFEEVCCPNPSYVPAGSLQGPSSATNHNLTPQLIQPPNKRKMTSEDRQHPAKLPRISATRTPQPIHPPPICIPLEKIPMIPLEPTGNPRQQVLQELSHIEKTLQHNILERNDLSQEYDELRSQQARLEGDLWKARYSEAVEELEKVREGRADQFGEDNLALRDQVIHQEAEINTLRDQLQEHENYHKELLEGKIEEIHHLKKESEDKDQELQEVREEYVKLRTTVEKELRNRKKEDSLKKKLANETAKREKVEKELKEVKQELQVRNETKSKKQHKLKKLFSQLLESDAEEEE